MLKFAEAHPRLASHYRRSLFAPSESYYQTILRNLPSLNLCTNNSLRLIRWTHPKTGHPDVLTSEDFEWMVNSGRHFARKIDQRVDARLLDLLDERLGVKAR